MTNTELLRKKIDESGYKIYFIAEKLGLTPQGLYLKLNNTNQFKAGEIQKLCQILDITNSDEMKEIFFDGKVAE